MFLSCTCFLRSLVSFSLNVSNFCPDGRPLVLEQMLRLFPLKSESKPDAALLLTPQFSSFDFHTYITQHVIDFVFFLNICSWLRNFFWIFFFFLSFMIIFCVFFLAGSSYSRLTMFYDSPMQNKRIYACCIVCRLQFHETKSMFHVAQEFWRAYNLWVSIINLPIITVFIR